MSVTVIKTSKRTLRSTCERCKIESDYYWAQIQETGVRVLLDQTSENEGSYWTDKAVPASTVHKCFRKQAGLDENGAPLPAGSEPSDPFAADPYPAPVNADPAPYVPVAPEPVTPAPATTAPAAGALDPGVMGQFFEMMQKMFGTPVDMEQVRAMVNAEVDRIAHPVKTAITNALTGVTTVLPGDHHEMLADVIGYLQDGHVYLVGPAGTGKSRMAEEAAEALEKNFYSLSLTQQTPVSALAGFIDANGTYHRTGYREAVEHGHVFLADEIDHGHANTVGFCNGATSNRFVAFPDGMVEVHPDFRLVAAANTYGQGQNTMYTGASQLDASTLNRFGKLEIMYDESIENAMVSATGLDSASQRKVLEFVRTVRRNALSHPEFKVVASPRNSERIAKALVRGETFDRAIEVHLLAGISADKRAKLTA
jgi:cobaltochelatase CobS